MQVLLELFTTDVGLMSIIGIAFMLGMGGFYLSYFLRHMKADETAARRDRQAVSRPAARH